MVQLNPVPVFGARKNTSTIWRKFLTEVSVPMVSAPCFKRFKSILYVNIIVAQVTDLWLLCIQGTEKRATKTCNLFRNTAANWVEKQCCAFTSHESNLSCNKSAGCWRFRKVSVLSIFFTLFFRHLVIAQLFKTKTTWFHLITLVLL